jgi:hypothetical protein
MKFEWRYSYVPDGQLEPDEYGRWAIECFIYVHIDNALPAYKEFKPIMKIKDYLPVKIAIITQKGTKNGYVPSTVDKFCAVCPSFRDAGGSGFATEYNFFSNDIEDLKSMVEKQFLHIQQVFMNCL